jgi:hypothetical protein
VRRAGAPGGTIVTVFGFSLVAVKTITWSQGDDGVDEKVTFEYGGMVVGYPRPNQPTFDAKGWNRVKNVAMTDPATVIQ